MEAPPYVIAASVTGPSHAAAGRPCQDAFAFRVLEDGSVVAAISDGLGSAAFADLGAATAVDAAVAACAAERSPAAGMVAARVAVEAAAEAVAAPLADFGCTLLVCLATLEAIEVAHLGDGAAVMESAGCFSVLSPPGDSEYVDEVTPLTSRRWSAETRAARGQGAAIALLTDGCQRAAIHRRGAWTAHPGWWAPIFRFARGAPEPSELTRFLGGRRLSEHSDDDKTLLIAVLR